MRFNMVLKNKLKKGFAGASLIAILGMSLVTGVSASTDGVVKSNDVDLTINSSPVGNGGLDLRTSEIIDFGAIELGDNPELYNTSFESNFTVTDLRGTQEGYSLSLAASQFENEDGHKLPAGSLSLDGIASVERVGTGTGHLPETQLNSLTAIDDGEVKIVNAEVGKGAGVFDINFDEDALGLTVDATTAKVGTYESTLIWNLQATPVAE